MEPNEINLHIGSITADTRETPVQCFPLVWTHRNNYARTVTRLFKREWCGYERILSSNDE
ncbi:hypothetical protein T265_06620 [Opisthorchis viverrini]|uniref:Uncharacterized protein n=1 Tax=Opisthorchis viverrini TaxID=6198 RepID=A0A074ZJT6_OPIVI|nr:hypothetical protein T265_06620 [Opisthorchis viverrini]KER26042.1 hypothetical protein T265_06620 [Opisthorchis viverrini]